MQYLIRPEEPAILKTFDYKIDKWNKISTSKKDLIWIDLTKMQGNRCAYCQGKIKKHERHIEHFIKRDDNPSLTFTWSNLFGSCKRKDGCGFYKDNQKHIQGVILKPDIDDPSEFFHFLSTGRLSANKNISLYDQHRATETIRVFNLDPEISPMRYLREQAIKIHSHLVAAMLKEMTPFADGVEIVDYSEILNDILENYLERISGIPYELAVKSHMKNSCKYLLER